MKYVLLLALGLSGPVWGLLTQVRDRNVAVASGTAAYARGDAARAAAAFATAVQAQARRVPDPRLLLNLAHAQALAGQPVAARYTYGRLLTASPSALGSVARQQLAVLAAQQNELAQALNLLKQALLLDPSNAGARYNYEVLSTYLAKRASRPTIAAPPVPSPAKPKPSPSPDKTAADQNQPANKAGTNRPGEINDPKPAPAPNMPADRRADPTGQPDNKLPAPAPGAAARGGRTAGSGPVQPLASGAVPGTQRGFDRNSAAAGAGTLGGSNRPGTDAAMATDNRLQTQRERLQAMNLSPAQARQLLETLRAQEQQYLQQLARPAGPKPDPSKPTW